MSEAIYPISEIFYSIQGEGENTGRAMVFVRLAGCTVGKRYPAKDYKKTEEVLGGMNSAPVFEPAKFPIWQNKCTIYDGREFPCDTDYRVKEKLTVEQIVERIKELAPDCHWVSITGGEPLMHNLLSLTQGLAIWEYKTQLETSGTIEINDDVEDSLDLIDHLVVSPKFGFIEEYGLRADEIRVLIDDEFDIHKIPDWMATFSSKIWISPINEAFTLKPANIPKCIELVKMHPQMRISLQIHKLLQVR